VYPVRLNDKHPIIVRGKRSADYDLHTLFHRVEKKNRKRWKQKKRKKRLDKLGERKKTTRYEKITYIHT
jgi:hypothetical protein